MSLIGTLAGAYVMSLIKKNEEKSDREDAEIDRKYSEMYASLKTEIDKNDDEINGELKEVLQMFRENDRELYKLVGSLERVLEFIKGEKEGENNVKKGLEIERLIESVEKLNK